MVLPYMCQSTRSCSSLHTTRLTGRFPGKYAGQMILIVLKIILGRGGIQQPWVAWFKMSLCHTSCEKLNGSLSQPFDVESIKVRQLSMFRSNLSIEREMLDKLSPCCLLSASSILCSSKMLVSSSSAGVCHGLGNTWGGAQNESRWVESFGNSPTLSKQLNCTKVHNWSALGNVLWEKERFPSPSFPWSISEPLWFWKFYFTTSVQDSPEWLCQMRWWISPRITAIYNQSHS